MVVQCDTVFGRLGKDRELMVGLQADFRARLRLNYGQKEAIIKIFKEYFFYFFPIKKGLEKE